MKGLTCQTNWCICREPRKKAPNLALDGSTQGDVAWFPHKGGAAACDSWGCCAGGCQLLEDTAQLPRCWSPVVLTYLKYMGLLSSSEGTKKNIYIYTTEQLDWKELYVVPWGSANSDGIGLGKGDHKVM